MSAGSFDRTARYELDTDNGGYIVKARVQPETLAATDGTDANAIPADPVDISIHAYARKGKKEYGIGMRRVILTDPDPIPDGYSGEDVSIPVMTPATFAAWSEGDAITYLGSSWTLLDKVNEELQ
jgi:hypothetical protein